jgi:hypothetical protein
MKKIFSIALQLEVMAVIWAILAVLSFQTYSMGDMHWFIKYISYISGGISIVYFIASIIKTRKRKNV